MPNRQPSGRFDYNPVRVPAVADPLTMHVAEVRMVSEGFFEAMGIPLRAGRTFRCEDGPGAEPVMVISERARPTALPGPRSGRSDCSTPGPAPPRRRRRRRRAARGPAAFEPAPAAYLPMRQDCGRLQWFAGMNVIVRGRDPAALAASLRALVLSLDPEMPPFNVRTLDDEVSRPGGRAALQRVGARGVRAGRARAGGRRRLRRDGVLARDNARARSACASRSARRARRCCG